MMNLKELDGARREAREVHMDWKSRLASLDNIASGKWHVVWPDDFVTPSEPLVENIYLQALEDKANSLASGAPKLIVPPKRGTRRDRGESSSQLRRRVMTSYWQRSQIDDLRLQFAIDLLHAGAMFATPDATFYSPSGEMLPPIARFPFIQRIDPRHAYPLAHDSRGRLTELLVMRRRPIRAVENEWGRDHEIFKTLDVMRAHNKEIKYIDEVWHFDTTHWSCAFGTASVNPFEGYRNQHRTPEPADTNMIGWGFEPQRHGLGTCPVVESKRLTHDGQYTGALEDVLPPLRVANKITAFLLDDLSQTVYAPVVMDNISNPEDFGPGGTLVGTGAGAAAVDFPRPPVNFEAHNIVQQRIEGARRQAAHPQQRSGEPGASITSGKGTVAVMGAFNSELASGQRSIESLLRDVTMVTAAYDEIWCNTDGEKKQIMGFEGGREFVESYNPRQVFDGDYRCTVSYGDRAGLDEQNHLTKLATVLNLGGMSRREFMEKVGVSDDPLSTERDIVIEGLTDLFTQGILGQMIQGGDLSALQAFVERIDADKETIREAVLATIQEMQAPQPAQGQGAPAAGGNGQIDVTQMMRSLASGGIPGNAEGLPPVGPDLRNVLPAGVGRALSEVAPGGTAA